MIPTRAGSTCQRWALARTMARAARASAGAWVRRISSPSIGLAISLRIISPMNFIVSAGSAGVWIRRYLRTKAAIPRAARARATCQPSWSIARAMKAPPGATITAAPVALAGSGRTGVRVGRVTLRTIVGAPAEAALQTSLAALPGVLSP